MNEDERLKTYPLSTSYYFYDNRGQRIGPLSYEDMVVRIQNGQLQSHHQTWKTGEDSWDRLEKFTEFNELLGSLPPPLHSTSFDLRDYLWYSKKTILGPDYGLRLFFLDAILIWFLWEWGIYKAMSWRTELPQSIQGLTSEARLAAMTLLFAFIVARILDTALTLRRIQSFELSKSLAWTYSIFTGLFRWIGLLFIVGFMGNFVAVDDFAGARAVVLLTIFWIPIMGLTPTLSLILKNSAESAEKKRKNQRWMKATLAGPIIMLLANTIVYTIIKSHFEVIMFGGWMVLIGTYLWYRYNRKTAISAFSNTRQIHPLNATSGLDKVVVPPPNSYEPEIKHSVEPLIKKRPKAKYSISEQIILWIALSPAILPFLMITLQLLLSIFGIDAPWTR